MLGRFISRVWVMTDSGFIPELERAIIIRDTTITFRTEEEQAENSFGQLWVNLLDEWIPCSRRF